MRTRRTFTALVAFAIPLALVFAIIAASFGTAADLPPTDLGTLAYAHGANTSPGLIALWRNCPAVAIICAPGNFRTTNFVWEYLGTNFVCSTTNVYQSSQYKPLSWDTTLWPWANANGMPFGFILVTNPPTRIMYDNVVDVTTNIDGTVATLTNRLVRTVTAPISNLWINVSASSNGWLLLN